MPFTYLRDVSRDLDKVRLTIGDTDGSDFELHDGEIDFFLSDNGDDVKQTSIACAKAIAAKFSGLADLKVGEESESASQLSKQYWSLAKKLEEDVSFGAGISAGGLDIEGEGGQFPAFKRATHMETTGITDETTE
jgi:hypothetical protein